MDTPTRSTPDLGRLATRVLAFTEYLSLVDDVAKARELERFLADDGFTAETWDATVIERSSCTPFTVAARR